MQIGTYKTIQGTIGNDVAYVTPKIAYFGNSGDDDIWIQGSEYLYLENQYWWVPSIAVGGTGNDKYTVAEGFAFIADGSKSNADKLLIYGSLDEIEVLFSIDERHIFISLSSETTIVLFDALNELGAIETIQFQKSSASRPVTISTDSLMNYRSLPNQTFESLISGGYFNPKVMGVANANEVRNIINRISELTTAVPTYTLTPSVETINEGAVLTTEVATTNGSVGTKLYYALSGTGITATDFSAGGLTGEGIIDSKGKITFFHTLANDLTIEGLETLEIKLYSDFARTLKVGTTATVRIVDTSIISERIGSIPLKPEALSQAYEFPEFKQIPYPYLIQGPGLPSTYDKYPDRFSDGFQPAQNNNRYDYIYRWNGVTGSQKNDIIIGGKYIDEINGGDGDDIIYGGNNYSDPFPLYSPPSRIEYQNAGIYGANDILTGGSGSDTFILNTVNAVSIMDFELGVDRIRFYKEETIFGGRKFPALEDLELESISSILHDAVLNSSGYPIAYIKFFKKPSDFNSTVIAKMIDGGPTDYSYSLSKLSGLISPNSLIGAFENYQFYNLGGNRQGIQKKGTGAIDEITGISTLTFDDSRISVSDNIIGVFNQVTGKETKDAQMFRLYNASFNRFPDSDGLKYWINEYSKGITDYRNIAESFIISNEFKQRYGATNTNLEFATNMYKNILGRLPDSDGLNYWVSNLDAGTNSRVDVLGGFSESIENKNLFSQVTGFV